VVERVGDGEFQLLVNSFWNTLFRIGLFSCADLKPRFCKLLKSFGRGLGVGLLYPAGATET
jgi:hypothetical protein